MATKKNITGKAPGTSIFRVATPLESIKAAIHRGERTLKKEQEGQAKSRRRYSLGWETAKADACERAGLRNCLVMLKDRFRI